MLSEKQLINENPAVQDGKCVIASFARQENEITVDRLPPSREGVVIHLPDNPLLPMLGIRPGKKVKMVTCQRFGGPLILKTNGRCVALSRSLARKILVNTIPATHTGREVDE